MVGGTIGSARVSANTGIRVGNTGIGGSAGVDGVGVCLVNIDGMDVGCVVIGAVFVPELLGCVCNKG